MVKAFTACAEALRPIGPAIQRSWQEFMTSADGQYLRAVVDYYDRRPGELDAVSAAREAEAVMVPCHCLCARWGHIGACRGYATTQFDVGGWFVSVCGPCAARIGQ